jgi:hypothetical protein
MAAKRKGGVAVLTIHQLCDKGERWSTWSARAEIYTSQLEIHAPNRVYSRVFLLNITI